MSTTIYYFTGTGNSLWAARCLAAELQDTKLAPIPIQNGIPVETGSEKVGIVFPVYMWGAPERVNNFINRLKADKTKYFFAVAVNAGQVAGTLPHLARLMRSRGMKLNSGFSLLTPSNYIPWEGAAPEAKQKILFDNAKQKIVKLAQTIKNQEDLAVEKAPLWQNIMFSALNKLSAPHIPGMDKKFFADEKCNGCKICEKICPAKNIIMAGGKPLWQHHCEQCMACIQWCPMKAIQCSRKTVNFERYHHPEVKLSDMMAE